MSKVSKSKKDKSKKHDDELVTIAEEQGEEPTDKSSTKSGV